MQHRNVCAGLGSSSSSGTRSVAPSVALAALILVGIALAAPARGAGEAALSTAPGAHEITCASPKALRAYQSGLRLFHLDRADEAAAQFNEAAKRDRGCAMAYWGLSRTLAKQGKAAEAETALISAEAALADVDDRERRLITAWAQWLKSRGKPAPEQEKTAAGLRKELDLLIALYPDDPEGWLLRGQLAESPLRATPYNLAALLMNPQHPFGQVWKPVVPPLPSLTPRATQPVQPLSEAPPLFDGLGMLSFPVTTAHPQAQAYVDQGLRTFHGYCAPDFIRGGAGQCFREQAVGGFHSQAVLIHRRQFQPLRNSDGGLAIWLGKQPVLPASSEGCLVYLLPGGV